MRKLWPLLALLLWTRVAAGMDVFSEPVLDDKGKLVLSGAKAMVYYTGTNELAPVYSLAGALLTQPISQDSSGYITFRSPDGERRVHVYGRGFVPKDVYRQFFDAADGDMSGETLTLEPQAIPPTDPTLGMVCFDGLGLIVWDGSNWRSSSGGIGNVNEDDSPELGGNLDVNGNAIVSSSNENIPITPNGSGRVVLDGLSWPASDGTAGQTLTTNGSASLSWTSAGSGDVVGPASATNLAVPLYSGTTGKILSNSGMIYNSGTLFGVSTMSGLVAFIPVTGVGVTIADNNAADVALTLANGGAGAFNIVVDGTVDGVDVSALSTSEGTAIHDATGGEIAAVTEKVTPASGDWLLIEDSAASNVKKKVQIGNLPTGGGGEANTASNLGGAAGVWENKTGIDLRFNSLSSNTTALTIAEDDGNDQIDFAIANAIAAGAAGLMSGTDKTKLDAIEAGADVTDSLNVVTAGAVMRYTANAKGDLLVGSADDTVTRLAVGTNGYVLTANSATGTGLEWAAGGAGSGDVTGPATSTDNAIATWNGTGGNALRNTALTYAAGTLSGAATISCVQEFYCDGAGTGLSFLENYASDVDATYSNTGTGDFNIVLDGTVNGVDIDATGITDGYVLTASGSNSAAWEAPASAAGDTLSATVIVESPADADVFTILMVRSAITVIETRTSLVGTGSPSAAWTLYQGATADATTTSIETGTETDGTENVDTSMSGTAAVAAGQCLVLDFGSITTTTKFYFTVYYTKP